jgi:hypothetical protein
VPIAHLEPNYRRVQIQSRPFGTNPLRKRAALPSTGAKAVSISPLLAVIIVLLFLPAELSFYIAGFRLTPIRLYLLLLTPVVLLRFGRSLASRQRHLVSSDILITFAGIWMIIAPTIVFDLGYALNHAVPLAIEFCGSYFATRILLSKRGQALNFVNFLCHAIAIVALSGAPDALTGQPFIHDFLRALTGYVEPYSMEYRLGIFRAMGPIDHPILFGTVCAFGLLLATSSPIRAKVLTIAACGFGVLLSMSSAPIQAAVIGLGLITYDRVLAHHRSRWWFLITIAAVGIGAIFVYSGSPIGFVFDHLLFDTSSGWVRVYEWDTATGMIQDSPWFGIAFQYAERLQEIPDLWYSAPSIDSYWLNLSLVYGIPCATFVGLAIIGIVCYPASGPRVNLEKAESKLASTLGIALFVVVFLGFTVDFWGICWMFVPLLVGVRAHLAELGSRRVAKIADRQEPSPSYSPAGA